MVDSFEEYRFIVRFLSLSSWSHTYIMCSHVRCHGNTEECAETARAMLCKQNCHVPHALANGRPGLPCLSEAVYNYLCFGAQCQFTPDLSIIPDFNVQKCLEEASVHICNAIIVTVHGPTTVCTSCTQASCSKSHRHLLAGI